MNVDTCTDNKNISDSEDSEDFLDEMIDEFTEFITNNDNSNNILQRIIIKLTFIMVK